MPYLQSKTDKGMNQEEKLKDKFGNEGGWKVPEGYFANFCKEMTERLPEYPEAPKIPDLTLWQKLKPYVYLAAMFAGIWLMMNVFHRVSSTESYSLDNPPEFLAQAALDSDLQETYHYISVSGLEDEEVEAEVISGYDNIKDFEKDFGVTLDPEYERITSE